MSRTKNIVTTEKTTLPGEAASNPSSPRLDPAKRAAAKKKAKERAAKKK